jgi:uncharacterized protein YyaL (SSP411 family)
VQETLAWVEREMTSADGPFYSTLDADSEGIEGKFYVWSAGEIERLLGRDDSDLFGSAYGVEPDGNWHDPHGHGPPDANILHRSKTFEQLARLHRLDEAKLIEVLARDRAKLFAEREKRIRPGRDEKTLTAWNGLMISAFAEAARTFGVPAYAETAAKAADFILGKMRSARGLLFRTWSAGSAPKLNAYLEDYSFLIDGLITLYEATRAPRWIKAALELTDVMIDQFWDSTGDGFFFTGRDHEPLIARNKDPHDNAIPSGNAKAVTALLKLVKLTGRPDLADKAERTLRLYRGLLAQHPLSAAQMLIALDFHLGPVQEVVVVGGTPEERNRLINGLSGQFAPNRIVAVKSPSGESGGESQIPLLAGKESIEGKLTTYICRDFVCQTPLTGIEEATAALGIETT